MGAKEELLALGLKPMTWAEVLKTVQAKLEPPDREKFQRLHRNFVGYLSPDTLGRFYGFVFAHGLQLEVNNFRFARLEGILDALLRVLPAGQRILDVGAGSGLIATVLLKQKSPKTCVMQDPVPEVRDFLLSMGFPVLPHPVPETPPVTPFDSILCIDSLGEINSDEDGALRNPDSAGAENLSALIEDRYGFAQKLEPWKRYLAPGGKLFLWEPIGYRQVWESIARSLEESGWRAQFQGDSPRHSYLELTLPTA